jgi:hypothetical protein
MATDDIPASPDLVDGTKLLKTPSRWLYETVENKLVS